MNMTTVKSGNVVAVGYSGTTLRVQFRSGVYDYYDVPAGIWERLQNVIANNESIGAFISANVVKAFKFMKVPQEKSGG